MSAALETVELEVGPEGQAVTACVIWMHGLGADGHDFEPVVAELGLPEDLKVRFIFPHAPYRPVTLNNGFVMRAWYDITALDRSAAPDAEGIDLSVKQVRALVDAQIELGIPAQRIVLAGFSQGGVVALHLGLFMKEPLAGIIALSTYLPLQGRLRSDNAQANLATPMFVAHGRLDPTLPYAYGTEVRDLLVARGHAVQWHEYAMGHSVCMEEIASIGEFLRESLGGA